MRAVVQRVSRASVTVDGQCVGKIAKGFAVLLAVEVGDAAADVEYLCNKVAGLRVFEDADGKMNLSLDEVDGELLVISQFTLMGDCRKGRRPSFVRAAPPELADKLYKDAVEGFARRGFTVATGRFRAEMQLELVNEGPVTLLIDSKKVF
jgi:D-tyrosyl-tRNA(Tyr) deacylase